MESLNFSAQFSNKDAKLNVTVNLFKFEEEGNTIIYSPAFDISGYGKTEEEAKSSFQVSMAEFFDYTTKKKTLTDLLKELGWSN
jgi:hypothetical protein